MFKELFKKKNSLILVMIVLMIVLAVAGVFYGQFYVKNNATTFDKSGYIINVNPQAESAKYNFASGQEYKKSFNNTYEFLNTSGEAVTLEKDSFLFYDDGSYSSMSRGVLLDIPEIATGNYINHYSIAPFMEVSERNGYEIENGEDPVTLREVLWKTSESKFLVLSKSLKVYFSEDDVRDVEDFIEINYIDAGVVQLVTKENVWQTVSEDAKIITEDGAVIYLVKEIVEFNDKQMLLSKLVLDSSENVKLSPLEQKSQFIPEFDITGKDGEDGESGSSGNSGNNGEDGIKAENGLNGNLGGNGSDGEEGTDGEDGVDATIDSTFNTAIPQIVLESWKVDATSFDGKYRVEDPNNLLKEGTPLNIRVVESVTNQVIDVIDANGGKDFGINHQSEYPFASNTTLKPDTEYKLVIGGTYVVNGSEHSRDFLTKVFYTDSLGILIEKNPSEVNSVSFRVTKKDYSVAAKATLYLLTEEQHLAGFDPVKNTYASQEVDLNQEINDIMFMSDFESQKLKSNTKYYARLTVEVDENGTLKTYTSQQVVLVKTLKQTPEFTFSPVAISNRSDWLFELYGGNVSDPDKAVVSYVYEVKNAENDSELVKTVNVLPSNLNSASPLYIDDVSIHPGVKYNFSVRAVYNDNEKDIEVVSNSSSDFIMEGSQLPAVRFVSTKVTAETIQGDIVINLNNSKINVDSLVENPITVTMICEGVYSKTLKYDSKDDITVDGDVIYLPINESGLNQNRIYRFDVSAFVDYIGNGNKYEYTNIGHVVQATGPLTEIKATWDRNVDNSNHAFAVGLKLEGVNVDFLDNYDSSILGLVQIGLYDTENRQVGNTLILKNEGEVFDSKLKNELVRDGIVITEETFGLTSENLLQDIYNIKINSVYDYTANVDKTVVGDQSAKLIEYVNDYKLNNGVCKVTRTSTVPKLPGDPNGQIIVNPIVNSSSDKYGEIKKDNLPDGAIIGYEITPNYNNAASLARKVHIYGFKNESFDGETEKIYKDGKLLNNGDFISHKVVNVDMKSSSLPKIALFFDSGVDGSVFSGYVKYYDENLTRGEIYDFAYAVEYAEEKDLAEPSKVYPYETDEFTSSTTIDNKAKYVLNTKDVVAPKAKPEFYMYTYDKNSTQAEFKYMYRDNDGSLKDRDTGKYKTNYKVNNGVASEIELVNPYVDKGNDYWGNITTNSVDGKVNFAFDWVPYNDVDDNVFNTGLPATSPSKVNTTVNAEVLVTKTKTNNNYDGVSFNMGVIQEKNLVTVQISAADREVLNNIVGIKMVFTSDGKTATYDLPYTVIEDTYPIGLSKISNVVGTGQNIAVSATIYYDTGNEGWKYVEGNDVIYALQDLSANRYLVYNVAADSNTLSESAAGSLYKTNKINLSNLSYLDKSGEFSTYPINAVEDRRLSFNVKAINGGLLLQEASNSIADMQLVPKKVNFESKKALNDITVSEIIPSVQSHSYQPAMNYVVLDKLDVFGTNFIDDNSVTLEVFKGLEPVKEIKYPLNNCNNDGVCTLKDVTVDGLEPNTTYTLKMKGSVNGNVTHFIDANDPNGEIWSLNIETSDKASLLDLVDPEFVFESYNNKYIKVGYGISQIRDLKIVYDILDDSTGDIVLSSYNNSIRTELTPLGYVPENNVDKLYIDKAWFAKGENGENPIIEYGKQYRLCFRLLRIDDQGNYVIGDDSNPETMGDSVSVPIVFKDNDNLDVFHELWITTGTGDDEGKMFMNIKLSAISDPNCVIMTEPSTESNPAPGSYYYAYLYEKNGDEDETLVATFTDENNQGDKKGALDSTKLYQFSHEVKRSHTYLLRLYAAVDKNYDGIEDDYPQLINNSIVSLDDTTLKENLGSLVLFERDPYFTPDNNGISMGNQSLGASTNATNKIMVTYKDAVNINRISKVTYNIVNSVGALVSAGELMNDNPADNPLFVPRAGGYFTMELPYELKEKGNYHITILYEFINDSGAYEEHGRFSDNYVY